jgi:spore coat polysaccharide biosynthesis protein SpsF (cytidylyltransferase family)
MRQNEFALFGSVTEALELTNQSFTKDNITTIQDKSCAEIQTIIMDVVLKPIE